MAEFTPASDLRVLEVLPRQRLAQILRLLGQKNPRKDSIQANIPEEFLRLLYVYENVLRKPSAPENIVEGLASVRDWFEEHFPALEEKPGYPKCLEVAIDRMKGLSLGEELESPTDARLKEVAARIGTITAYTSQPALSGPDYRPTLRVFLFNDERLLLDSTGDWFDWLYLTRQLFESINEQTDNLPAPMQMGSRVVRNLKLQLDVIERNVAIFRQFLDDHTIGEK